MTSWNPWHGCHKISAGCLNCYVYRIDEKHGKDSSIVTKTANFNLPLKRTRKKDYKVTSDELVWTCFSSDFLLEEADEWRIDAWKMIKERSDCTFLFITKRIDRLTVNLPDDWGNGYDNVVIGCTCENQDRADYRLPIFLSLPIKHRFIACEPLIEAINLTPYLGEKIEKVVVGGESGLGVRICDYDWVLKIRGQCEEAGVPFQFRQTGANLKISNKVYRINRKFQFSQAQKAGIDFLIEPTKY